MCELKKYFQIILLISSLTLSPAYAALVEVAISGSTNNTSASLIYTPGTAFTVKAVYDTSVPKNPTNNFFVTSGGQSSLVSFELTTDMGTISYLDSNRTLTSFPPLVYQTQGLNRQSVIVDYLASNTFPVAGDGFNSTMSNFTPGSFGFVLGGSGTGNNIFTDDIDKLFSGIDTLPSDANLLGSSFTTIGVDGNGVATGSMALIFDEFSQYSIKTISTVPIPAAVWLFASGIIGLISIAKRKS